jgi:TetR/AcrR family transcriptional regulator
MKQKRPASAQTSRRGRPDTSEALIDSARALFARRGFDGASIRAITRAAGANLGGVTYHFGSKHALYEAVLDHVLSPLGERVSAAAAGAGSALDRLEAVVRAFFEHLDENPDMPQLMLQEMAAGKDPPPPVRRVLGRVSGALVQLIRAGQSAGEIRAGDPLLLALSCVYQPVHLTLVRRVARSVIGLDMAEPETHARVIEHSVSFVRAALGKERR